MANNYAHVPYNFYDKDYLKCSKSKYNSNIKNTKFNYRDNTMEPYRDPLKN